MAGQDLQRREMLRIMATAAAASGFPGFSKWAFICSHDSSAVERIRPESYQPVFFSSSEYAIVERLAEIIIPSDTTPGAKEAGVAEFVDFMVAHDSEQQYPMRLGIGWLNAHCERLLGKAFLALSDAQQISVLEPLAYKAKYREGEEDGRKFFSAIKELTVMGFYTTEIGYKEIDNPALKFYAKSPACPHPNDPEHKHLPPPKW
jgi:gluconate 2-dehydrogenase subunit 3-like protein